MSVSSRQRCGRGTFLLRYCLMAAFHYKILGRVWSQAKYPTVRQRKMSDNICKWVHGIQDQRVLELVEAVGGWSHGQHAKSHLAGSLRP